MKEGERREVQSCAVCPNLPSGNLELGFDSRKVKKINKQSDTEGSSLWTFSFRSIFFLSFSRQASPCYHLICSTLACYQDRPPSPTDRTPLTSKKCVSSEWCPDVLYKKADWI
ncbi:uncharacterized protein B0I36DRAFT_30796 [Microdochium trichocladiopsis]|uniref:Uncharacterized protein n=1 Tax=Microdochium trichocladiopsis TaxID=1682393 RepID=A0A9P8XVH3_9PEZI|nr:uncharacterized protein B0I36DRAFT_30796 [Microdochium trichocladiopsis]KAH7021271.1 hypothetical protein B0I36DRAFT_30796 [Microdochium trichocladiopsis]